MKPVFFVLVTLMSSALAFGQTPAVPTTPAAIDELILARPFALDEGFEFSWRSEKPTVTQGILLVLKANPDLVYPRQTAQPILYVGDQTAMRLNIGYPSGYVIALVPGGPGLREGQALIWFGTPGLPEQVTSATIANEASIAAQAGIQSLSAQQMAVAFQRGGAAVQTADVNALLDEVGDLFSEFSDDAR